MVLVMGCCHKPTSTAAVRMPLQKQLRQGLAVQVHKQVSAFTQGGFLHVYSFRGAFLAYIVFLLEGGKLTPVLLVPRGFYNCEFLNSSLALGECAFDNDLSG